MNNKICVIGGATWDVFFTTPQAVVGRCSNDDYLMFPYGGKIDALDVKYGFGGGAANVAISLSRLGLSVNLVSRLGKDWRGKEIVKNLNYHRVKTNLVQYDSQQVTPLSFIATSGGSRDHVAFVDRGAAKHLKSPVGLNKDFNWFYVTSLANKTWPVFLTKLFTTAVKQGQKVFWNPGAEQLADKKSLGKLLPLVDILDVNKEEAETLTNLNNVTVPVLLKKIKDLGCRAVLITNGDKGAYYFDGHSLVYQPSFKVKPVNTTGAGDSFGSAWLAGYIYSAGNIQQAMLWGMRNASSVIKTVGAQKGLLDLKDIKK